MDNNFGIWLQQIRESKKLTQAELARKAKINRAVINKIENNASNPTPETLKAIAHGLDLSTETVFRAAGLLPPAANKEDESIDRLLYRISKLSPEDQAQVDDLIELLLTRREKLRASKPSQQTQAPDTP